MTLNLAYLFGLSMFIGASAPRFDIVDEGGLHMFQVQRGGMCFVGCNIKLERADGVICSGFAPGIEAGAGLSALVRCPEYPSAGTRRLVTTPLRADMTAIGVLGPLKSTERRNREATENALAHADQLNNTN